MTKYCNSDHSSFVKQLQIELEILVAAHLTVDYESYDQHVRGEHLQAEIRHRPMANWQSGFVSNAGYNF